MVEDKRGGRRTGIVLLLVLLAVLGAILIGKRRQAAIDHPAEATSVSGAMTPSCSDPLPSGVWTSAKGRWPQEGRQSQTRVTNDTSQDRIVELLANDQLVISIAVPSGQTSAVDLPIGQYRWRLRHGAAWCERKQQFLREVRTQVAQPLDIVATSTLTIHIEDDANRPNGFQLRTTDAPVVAVSPSQRHTTRTVAGGSDVYLLRRSERGHYLMPGAVNDEELQFVVDTGASAVAVPVSLAQRLGHHRGIEVTTQTANGTIVGYEFVAREVRFGPFVARDVRVVALPNLHQPLLGMSLIGTLNLRQTAEGLELAVRP